MCDHGVDQRIIAQGRVVEAEFVKGRALFPQDRAHRNPHTGDQIDQFRAAGWRFQIFDAEISQKGCTSG
ncbi:hypothetical protein AA18889_1551 [Acetobacter senegalensis DSM 18889]|nr:hypothetical protein AA18889_1551 [Acetobacter senegalensis DSM 18889]